ncbi:MAG: hypothetical protein DWQ09_18120 [Proteobacteria bacterium]|nr:MAG: hypothetical protein DWQ09_18120 [Pseudomonadota bacterium]QKK11910.1 MAG: hypothetical protein HND59_10260 [Pseudomonadota bacterium]
MLNRNRFLRLFTVAVLLLGQGVVFAQYPMPPMGVQQPMMPMPGAMPGMQPMGAVNPLAVLGLTNEQLQQLTEIGNAARDASLGTMKSMGEVAQKLPGMMMVPNPDPQAIGAMYGKMFALQQQLIEAAIATYNKQLAVFTKEQREKWEAMRRQMPGFPAAPR